MRIGLVFALLIALPSAALAEPDAVAEEPTLALLDGPGLELKPPPAIARYLGDMVLDTSRYEGQLAFGVDIRARHAHFRLGGGRASSLSLSLSGNVDFRSGYPLVSARLDLALAGGKLTFELPDVRFIPRTRGGETYVEYQVPLLRGSF